MATLIKILDNAKFLSKTVLGEVSPVPTYNLGSDVASVNEGSSVTFTLSTTNVANGTLVPYVITGVSLADLASGALTGNFTVSNNIATASITLAADALTEGAETMTVSLSSGVASASVVVNDTSRTPTYAIGRSLSAVDEGSSVTFTLSTTNVANGTVLPYTISGISANDVTTGSLTGSFTVSNNIATATITMSADQLTEGAETATLTLNNGAASNFVVVNDTSTTPVPLTISGLQLWLDAADASTLFDATVGGNLVTTDGVAVARWQDKSGNNRHATQATVNARPTFRVNQKNTLPGLSFDGNDFLSRTQQLFTTNYSMFVIAKFNNNTSRYALIDLANPNEAALSHVVIEQNTFLTQGQRYGFLTSGTALDSNISTSSGEKLFTVFANASAGNNIIANTTYRVNGATATLSVRYGGAATYNNYTGINGYVIGGFNNGNNSSQSVLAGLVGSIYEVVVYNSVLTTTQRQAVETYLNSKWALY